MGNTANTYKTHVKRETEHSTVWFPGSLEIRVCQDMVDTYTEVKVAHAFHFFSPLFPFISLPGPANLHHFPINFSSEPSNGEALSASRRDASYDQWSLLIIVATCSQSIFPARNCFQFEMFKSRRVWFQLAQFCILLILLLWLEFWGCKEQFQSGLGRCWFDEVHVRFLSALIVTDPYRSVPVAFLQAVQGHLNGRKISKIDYRFFF